MRPENWFAEELVREEQRDAEAAIDEVNKTLRAEDRLAYDPEYNPWTVRNFQEAIAQTDATGLALLVGAMKEAARQPNGVLNSVAVNAVKQAVEGYWYREALK